MFNGLDVIPGIQLYTLMYSQKKKVFSHLRDLVLFNIYKHIVQFPFRIRLKCAICSTLVQLILHI